MSFIPENLSIENAEDIVAFYENILNRNVETKEEFAQLLSDVSDLESAVSEDLAWRYINMTCDTQNKEYEKKYLNFVQNIQPSLAPLEDQINKKINSSPYVQELQENSAAHRIYFRSIAGAIEIFREENIPLQAELQSLAQEYSSIQGAMSVVIQGEEMTLQKAANFLLNTNRNVREEAWKAMQERRLADTEKLEELFDSMVAKRHQVAVNAGFSNYRDYMFKALGRFDYSVQDCLDFHAAIEHAVVPLLKKLTQKRKELLNLEVLKPWDTSVDAEGRDPLKPFATGTELADKSILCFEKLNSFFGECLQIMKNKSFLDLESRKGKAPGGYNYPLAKTNMPFIFMNATGNLRDLETMVHEGGHAIHSFLMAPLPLNAFKNTPSEVAELASMSMELISMDAWDVFFSDQKELKRAKLEQLEGIVGTLPWIATVDAFQHWVYTNPNHSRTERAEAWLQLCERFGTGMVDYSGFEDALKYSWHKQLHIFEVPFYYIEYGFAQLGAIGMYKQYVANKENALKNYVSALKLGYTQSIPEIYKTAGLQFQFSRSYVDELFQFLDAQMN